MRLTADMLPEPWQLAGQCGRKRARTCCRSPSYAELEGLLAALREQGATIAELSLQEADLEEVFLRIMARHQ